MTLETIEQLRTYYSQLSWFQKYFLFPWALSSQLTKPSLNKTDLCNIYAQIHGSWLWFFYNWAFPELGDFFQSKTINNNHYFLTKETFICKAYDSQLSAFQTLESAGLLVPDLESNCFSSHQGDLLEIIWRSSSTKRPADMIVTLHAIGELTDENIVAMKKIMPLFSPDHLIKIHAVLEQTPNVNKSRFINFMLRKVESNDDAKEIIPLSDLLKKICDLDQAFDLISDKLGTGDVRSLIQRLRQSDYSHLSHAIRDRLGLTSNKTLFTGIYATYIFDILLQFPTEHAGLVLSIMKKLDSLPTLSDAQKTMFYLHWKSTLENRSWLSRFSFHVEIDHINDCINLFSRLDCVNNPANLDEIMLQNPLGGLFIVERILGFLNEHASRVYTEQVQADYDELMSKSTKEDMINYMKGLLNLDVPERDKLINTLNYEVSLHLLKLGGIFDQYGLSRINKFISDNRALYQPSYWVSFMETMHLLAKSSLITNCTQYDIRNWFVYSTLNLLTEGAQPFVAYTILMQLHRLKLLDQYTDIDLLLYHEVPFLHKMLVVWFEDQALCNLWNRIDYSQFYHVDYNRLIIDCQTILMGDKPKKLEAVRECVKDRLISLGLNVNLSSYCNIGPYSRNDQLIDYIVSMADNAKTLHLKEWPLRSKTRMELIEIFFILPMRVFLTKDSGKPARCMNTLIAQHLITQVNHIVNQHESTLNFYSVHFPVDIDETNLSKLISIIEQQSNPLAYLTCGLLLTGDITNSVDPKREGSELDEYSEKRLHDAIRFYNKAAHDPKLKPVIDYLLWDMKTLADYESLKNKLMQYDVTPAHVLSTYSMFSKRAPVIMPFILNEPLQTSIITPCEPHSAQGNEVYTIIESLRQYHVFHLQLMH